jgi:molybdopterin molybdotransferase
MVIASIFVRPVIRKMLCQEKKEFQPTIPARLMANFPSVAGREDWVPVSLRKENDEWLADPIFFKSNLIFNLVRADALVHIPADLTGLQAGEKVFVEIL